MHASVDAVIARLRASPAHHDDIANWHPDSRAAVLILLTPSDAAAAATTTPSVAAYPHALNVLLTRRADSLRTHRGEVALPGGKKDPEDVDLIATALREASEEIGLPPGAAQVIATFPPATSKHNLLVTPIVALLKTDLSSPFIPKPNPQEVESVFQVPLERFLDANGHKCVDFPKSSGKGFWRAHWFDWVDPDSGRDYVIFGLTAGILIHIASAAYNRPPGFELIPPPVRSDLIQAFPQPKPEITSEKAITTTTSGFDEAGKQNRKESGADLKDPKL
ncbi:hypothetical protein HDU67_001677 [Dinochytrium kinnereticum]|nr:hypothetical protein HDU67_001677 [Dinochytrium kinnereticum]